MYLRNVFLFIILSIAPLTAQQSYRVISHQARTSSDSHKIAAAVISGGQSMITNKTLRHFQNFARLSARCLSHLYEDDHLLQGEEKQKYDDEFKNLRAEWKSSTKECVTFAKERLIYFVSAYAFMWFISSKLTPQSALYTDDTWTETVAIWTIPFFAARIVDFLVHSCLSARHDPQQNSPVALKLSRPQAIIIATATTIAYYYAWFKIHDHYHPYVMPTQRDHAIEFGGKFLLPAICNVLF
jgi:hypothetical protein